MEEVKTKETNPINEHIYKNLNKVLCTIEKKPTGRKKDGKDETLSYISWADAFNQLFHLFNDDEVQYDVVYNEKREDGLPIFGNEKLGYIVKTWIQIRGIKRYMIMPITNGVNKSLKDNAWEYTVNYYGKADTKKVDALTSFDINTSIQRCFVKNIAMFGLGIHVYQGEDLPNSDVEDTPPPPPNAPPPPANAPLQPAKVITPPAISDADLKKIIDIKTEFAIILNNYKESLSDAQIAGIKQLITLNDNDVNYFASKLDGLKGQLPK